MSSKAPVASALPAKQAAILDALKGGQDVSILSLYAAVWGDDGPYEKVPELRSAQQLLGAHITKLNRRIRASKQIVKPGRLKGTYCLTSL